MGLSIACVIYLVSSADSTPSSGSFPGEFSESLFKRANTLNSLWILLLSGIVTSGDHCGFRAACQSYICQLYRYEGFTKTSDKIVHFDPPSTSR